MSLYLEFKILTCINNNILNCNAAGREEREGEGGGREKGEAYLTLTPKCRSTEVDRCIVVNIKCMKLPVKYGDLFVLFTWRKMVSGGALEKT